MFMEKVEEFIFPQRDAASIKIPQMDYAIQNSYMNVQITLRVRLFVSNLAVCSICSVGWDSQIRGVKML